MKYISTRTTKREYTFTEAFLESFAEDGGLLCPKEIPRISTDTLEKWSVGICCIVKNSIWISLIFIWRFFRYLLTNDISSDELEVLLKSVFEKFHQRELVTVLDDMWIERRSSKSVPFPWQNPSMDPLIISRIFPCRSLVIFWSISLRKMRRTMPYAFSIRLSQRRECLRHGTQIAL